MAKSAYAQAVDEIQTALSPYLREKGFARRGRAFNRRTEDSLIQVVSIQMGASDPPGTTYIPQLRENLHGVFAINLGVYAPEVARHLGVGNSRSWVQEYHCCVRARLGELIGESVGIPFLERFATRDRILHEWQGRSENMGASIPPRIVSAIILVERGEDEQARRLLSQQVLETRNPGHPEYVRNLAKALGLGRLDG